MKFYLVDQNNNRFVVEYQAPILNAGNAENRRGSFAIYAVQLGDELLLPECEARLLLEDFLDKAATFNNDTLYRFEEMVIELTEARAPTEEIVAAKQHFFRQLANTEMVYTYLFRARQEINAGTTWIKE